jgi:hypothetical protein
MTKVQAASIGSRNVSGPMSNEVKFQENATCEVCGRYGAFQFDRFVCVDCYEASGSCCLEFGGDDLWEFKKDQQPAAEDRGHAESPRH